MAQHFFRWPKFFFFSAHNFYSVGEYHQKFDKECTK